MMSRHFRVLVTLLLGCGGGGELALPVRPPSAPPAPTLSAVPMATSSEPVAAAGADAAGEGAPARASSSGPCPDDMAFVDASYCPKPRLHCLSDEYNKPNHITICNRFAPGQSCAGKERKQRFCIDRYEYPNRPGAHPPVMVDAFDGQALCAARGKRLCWQSEWESACEGPEKLPFPYGLDRDATQCNIDNAWLKPDLDKVYAADARVAGAELLRLDQSVRSGAKPGCVSGFGVHDLTGNVDEWILSEENKGKSKWAGLKGGAWGHVRNACRPMTTSHPPEFTYYFISFRCCSDAAGEGGPEYWAHPPLPDKKKPGALGSGWTPDAAEVK